MRRAHAVLRRGPRADRGDRPTPRAGDATACTGWPRTRWSAALLALHDLHPVELTTRLGYARRHGAAAAGCARRRDRAERGRRRRHGPRPHRRGGCGVDTVRDVVEAAVAEAGAGHRGVVFDRAPAGPPLLQIGMRRRDVGRCAASCGARRRAGDRRRSGASCAPRRCRPSTRTSSSVARAAAAVRVPAVRVAVQTNPGGGGGTGGCPTGTCTTRCSRCPTRSGTSCRSRSGWRSSCSTRSARAVVACYPSPAGATESELTLAAWADGVGAAALGGGAGARRRGAAGAPR